MGFIGWILKYGKKWMIEIESQKCGICRKEVQQMKNISVMPTAFAISIYYSYPLLKQGAIISVMPTAFFG